MTLIGTGALSPFGGVQFRIHVSNARSINMLRLHELVGVCDAFVELFVAVLTLELGFMLVHQLSILTFRDTGAI